MNWTTIPRPLPRLAQVSFGDGPDDTDALAGVFLRTLGASITAPLAFAISSPAGPVEVCVPYASSLDTFLFDDWFGHAVRLEYRGVKRYPSGATVPRFTISKLAPSQAEFWGIADLPAVDPAAYGWAPAARPGPHGGTIDTEHPLAGRALEKMREVNGPETDWLDDAKDWRARTRNPNWAYLPCRTTDFIFNRNAWKPITEAHLIELGRRHWS